MILIPSAVAGITIGMTNQSLLVVILASFFWAGIFSLYLYVSEKDRLMTIIAVMRGQGQSNHAISPKLTVYFNDFLISAVTSLIFGLILYFTRISIT